MRTLHRDLMLATAVRRSTLTPLEASKANDLADRKKLNISNLLSKQVDNLVKTDLIW